jgi:hypothetical protein
VLTLYAMVPDNSNPDSDGIASTASDFAFAFALQLGARIGADPLHAPEIKDLVEEYQIKGNFAA